MFYIVESMSYSNYVTTGTLKSAVLLAANGAEVSFVGVPTARRCHGMLKMGV